jgi:O-antigen/teichoic acid export membrane protein
MGIVSPEIRTKYSKTIYWGKLISITGGAQILVQGIGLICGILVIRLLPVKEYAWYTIANTLLGTMSILADAGVTASVMAQGGKFWQDKIKLGAVLETGMHIRKQFAVRSLLISTPILIYLLVHNNASILSAVLIAASLIPAFLAELSDSLLEIPPKIHQDIVPLQKNQVAVTILRLLLSAFALFIFPFTFIAILASGISRMWGNIQLRKIAKRYVAKKQAIDPVLRLEILKFVRRILPHAIYYCSSGQITIWIISIYGSASSVAQAGALSRLAVMFILFRSLIDTLVIPRFARIPNNRKLLLTRYLQINGGLFALFLIIIIFISILPSQILWVLGNQYAGLQHELVICMASACVGTLAGALFHLNARRGHVINPLFAIPINIATIICCVLILNISTLSGVLYLSLIVELVQLLMNFLYGFIKISKTGQ